MIRVSRRLRDAVFILAIAIFSCALILAPPLDRLRGLSIDILTMLRWRVFGSMHKPEQSPTIVVALVVADKDRRFLRRSFALYLAPSVIEKMVTANKPPALGGEMRNVTIFFSDLAGFSSISEALAPPDPVHFMNEYLSAMSDIIQEQGGFVDKYIGDAIVAVFGAPVDDPNHAQSAINAALRCRDRLHKLNTDINSGDALVGNVGSRQHFNYTVRATP